MRYAITLVLACFILDICYGQEFSIGPLIGIHTYKVRFTDSEARDFFDSSSKLGYRAGFFVSFPLKNRYEWVAEAYYSAKGREVAFENFTNDADYEFLVMTHLLRKNFQLSLGEKIKGSWFVNVGPNISYWLGGDGELAANVSLDYDVEFGDAGTDIRTNYIVDGNRWLFGLDFGVGVGGAVFRPKGKVSEQENIQVELRYTLGQTFLGDEDGSVIPNILSFQDNLESSYRVLTLLVRYKIDLDLKNLKRGKSTIKN